MLTLKRFKQVSLLIALTLLLIWANLLKADDVKPIAEYRFDKLYWKHREPGQVINSSYSSDSSDSSDSYHAMAVDVQPSSEGRICSAANFDSDNSYILLDHDLLHDTTQFTLSVWVKTSNDSNQALFAGAKDFKTDADDANELRWWHKNATIFSPNIKGNGVSSINYNNIANIADNEWHHLVWRRDSQQSCFFINGGNTLAECTLDRKNGDLNSTARLDLMTLLIGQELDRLPTGVDDFEKKFDPEQRFKGLMDELLIFNEAIDNEKIKDIYINQNDGKNWDGTTREGGICDDNILIPPIAEYHFDELSWKSGEAGEVIDSINSDNNPSYNATAFGVQPTLNPRDGKICSAANFNNPESETDYIKLNNNLLHLAEQFTISMWIKSTHTGEQALISAAASDSVNNELLWYHNKKVFIPHINHVKDESKSINFTNFVRNNWQHWVWRRAGKRSCLFIDGKKVDCASIDEQDGALSINSLILGQELDKLLDNGGGFQSYQRFIGQLDELLIFNKAISDSQIETIFNNQDAGRLWHDDNPLSASRECNYAVDHYRLILNDNTGLTCAQESLQIKSCLNDDCSITYGEQSTIALTALNTDDVTWPEGSSSSFFGKGIFNAAKTETGTVLYDLVPDSDTPEAKNDFRCYVGSKKVNVGDGDGDGEECYTKFENAGFKLSTIEDQVAGQSFDVELQALKKGKNGACENIYSGKQNIKFTYNPITPTTDSSMAEAFTINDTAIYSDTEIEVNFYPNNDGKAILAINYLDAGEVSLTASADLPLSDSTVDEFSPANDATDFRQIRTINLDTQQQITATSNHFIVRPYQFSIIYEEEDVKGVEDVKDVKDVEGVEGVEGVEDVEDKNNFYKLIVYQIVKGDSKWPHGGGLKVAVAGAITVEDSNGISDDDFDDQSDHWGPKTDPIDTDDQIVQSSSVYDIEIGDHVDTRYSYVINDTDNAAHSADIHFLATNQGDDYGKYFVTTEYLDDEAVYYFNGYTQSGLVKYNALKPPLYSYVPLFKVAGKAFSIKIEAQNYQGLTTTNFSSENIIDDLQISYALQAPVADSNNAVYTPELNYSVEKFKQGVATISDAKFSEVGVITIDVKLPIKDYLNHQDPLKNGVIRNLLSNEVRFIPAQFSLTQKSVSNGCGEFTYFGQNFSLSYEIEAQNLQGDVVKNYFSNTIPANTFAKVKVQNLIKNNEVGNLKSASDLASRYSVTSPTTNWVEGVYTFEAENAVLNRDNDALNETALKETSENDLMTDLYPLVRLIDPDGTILNGLNHNANKVGDSDYVDSKSLVDNPLKMRFGRLVVGNNYGSEFESLQIPLQAEYWDGKNFVINTLDSCTIYEQDEIEVQNSHSLVGESSGVFALGTYPSNKQGLRLAAPLNTNKPRVFRVYYNVPYTQSWLRFDWNGDGKYNDANDKPEGELQFGAYRGNDRVIYWREN